MKSRPFSQNFFFVLLFCVSSLIFSCISLNKINDNYQTAITEARKNTEIFGKEIKLQKKSEKNFTLAVIPDTQDYVAYYSQKEHNFKYPYSQSIININQMKFIAKNSEINNGDIAFAVHLGDVVNELSWYPVEWEMAENALMYLNDVVPFIIVPGNHDYDKKVKSKDKNNTVLKGGTWFNNYFGPDSVFFKDKSWYGGSYNNGLNSWAIMNGGKYEFLVIGLELEPSDEVLEWAQDVIDSHSKLPVIVVTHSYLGLDKEKDGNAQLLELNYKNPDEGNSPKDIHKKFILKNKNIFLVLCGHCFSGDNGENIRIDKNEYGYTVYSLLSDYQARNELLKILFQDSTVKKRWCGDGWLRLLNFNFETKQIHVQTYSTEFNKFEIDSDSDFYLPIDWEWNVRFN